MEQKKPNPNSEIATFIKAARARLSINQETLGAIYDCTKGNVSAWENGRHEPPFFILKDLSKRSGVPLSEQIIEAPAVTSQSPAVSAPNVITLPMYDTGGAMGHGIDLKDQPGIIAQITVSPDWLQKNVKGFSAVGNLCVVTGFGDSMKGMYNPGDPLIVDIGVKTVDYDAVYFFRIGNEGFIKRLQRIPGRGLVAMSENKAYQDWTIEPSMDFEVFGRVVKAWESKDY